MAASIFATGAAPTFTPEQIKMSRNAWKPSKIRASMQLSGTGTILFRSAKAVAEAAARKADKAAVAKALRAAKAK